MTDLDRRSIDALIKGVAGNLARVADEAKWVESIAQPASGGQGQGTPVSTSDVADPTHVSANDRRRRQAEVALRGVKEDLFQVVRKLDRSLAKMRVATNSDLTVHQPKDIEPTISPAELAEANQAQAKRIAQGGGYGRS